MSGRAAHNPLGNVCYYLANLSFAIVTTSFIIQLFSSLGLQTHGVQRHGGPADDP